MSKIVGIDLGTTNSLVAVVDSGIPLVLADAAGHRLTPSVVHFPASDAAPVVGHAANRVRIVKPSETVYSVKRFIGRRGTEISEEEKSVTYALNSAGTGAVSFPIHGKNFTPEEISAAALQFVRKVSGYRKPSKSNQEAFEQAVEEVANATGRLLDTLKEAKAAGR